MSCQGANQLHLAPGLPAVAAVECSCQILIVVIRSHCYRNHSRQRVRRTILERFWCEDLCRFIWTHHDAEGVEEALRASPCSLTGTVDEYVETLPSIATLLVTHTLQQTFGHPIKEMQNTDRKRLPLSRQSHMLLQPPVCRCHKGHPTRHGCESPRRSPATCSIASTASCSACRIRTQTTADRIHRAPDPRPLCVRETVERRVRQP
jgi:hypothetical protein